MMVETNPNFEKEVGSSITGCEISSLLDGKLAKWSTAPCTLALTCRPFVSKEKKNERRFTFFITFNQHPLL
jgi:hypothetical protein